ncbi:hypothetical protein BC826DRAFT_1187839 [Russula brevipes]|nr:hypothetical protein BC826DRAFT_1187839 [Russula brevipes]
MNPVHTTANGVAFWSRDETTEEDPTALWSGTAGYGHWQLTLGLNSESALGGPITDIEWGAAAAVENTHEDIMTFALPDHDTNPTASPVSALPHSYPRNFDITDLDFLGPGPWLMPPSASPIDPSWADIFFPLAQHEQVAGTYVEPIPSGSASLAAPGGGSALFEQPGPFVNSTSSYFPGDGNMMRPITLNTHLSSTVGTMPGWSAKANAPTLGMWDVGSGLTMPHGGYMLASQRTSLGKRPRAGEETSRTLPGEENGETTCGPPKKFKGNMSVNGVLVAAGHASRAHQQPARTPAEKNDIFEAVECGAGTLAIPNVQEVCQYFLPGPTVQGSVSTTAQERLGGEGSGQGIPEATERDLIQIPRRLGKVHKALLQASSADWISGFVRTIKCRLCPGADFGHWEDYKRHCMYMHQETSQPLSEP